MKIYQALFMNHGTHIQKQQRTITNNSIVPPCSMSR